LKKPPYRAYKKKKEEPPVKLPHDIDTPEAEQLVSDIYRLKEFALKHWKKALPVLGALLTVLAVLWGYTEYRNRIELKSARLVDEGLALLEEGKKADALKLFNSAVEKYPSAPSARIAKFLSAKLSKNEALLKDLALQRDFLVSPPSKTSLMAVEMDRGNLKEVESLLSAMERDRDWTYPEALYIKVLLALKKGEVETAKEAMELLSGNYRGLPVTFLAHDVVK